MKDRRILRFLLAALAMALLCLTAFVALGWVLRSDSRWPVKITRRILGEERCLDLSYAYARTLGFLFPTDSDGDGFPDSVETYLKASNPRDPNDSPRLDFALEGRSVEATDITDTLILPVFLVQPGERRRIRLRVTSHGMHMAFAPGLQARVTPGNSGYWGFPIANPSADPFVVPVATDGLIEFDFDVPANSDGAAAPARLQGAFLALDFLPVQFVRTQRVPGICVVIAPPHPPLPCTVETVSPRDPARRVMYERLADSGPGLAAVPLLRLTWTSNDEAGPFYVEARRDEPGQPWFLLGVHLGRDRTAYIRLDSRPSRRATLKFRVLPTKAN